ncbi:hypothetical protein BHE74_00046041 [Ensete ventricosum]|nr:hypothetical protein BHE74_00046041 [Ensete ventricosum]
MGQVLYEYGYRVALAHFQARNPNMEVDVGPFTKKPEDSLVPMETRQEFDDSIPPDELGSQCHPQFCKAQRNKETTFLRLEFRAGGAGDEGGLDLSQETFFCSGVCQEEVSSLQRLPRDCSVIVVMPSFGARAVL